MPHKKTAIYAVFLLHLWQAIKASIHEGNAVQ